MRLIDADALLKEIENEQKYLIARGQLSEEHILVHALKRPVLDAPTVDAVEVVRCENCEHFDLNHFENFRGIPLIVAHEICKRWGNGCKTDSNGFCFLGDRRSDD